jgi:type IV pilus assembly protein PilO
MASTLAAFSFTGFKNRILGQFQNLDPRNPVAWPSIPRYGLFILLAIVIVVALWFVWLSGADDELQTERAKETKLREEYKTKLTKAINLATLLKQREQVLQYVTQLEKQLPSKAEMDALLSDINQAGLGRSLQFELFRPGQVAVRDFYAELPIAIRVSGRFHDMGSFASDIANLSRIVTLNNLAIVPGKDGFTLTMDATAKTFRYLDADEVAEQQRAAAKAKGAKK